MKKLNTIKFISTGGLLSTIAVIFQAAPVFLPTFGLALSPFSTLPIAIAANLNISLGVSVLFTSMLILIFISIEEALILLFTTGLLGIVLGLLYKRRLFLSIIFTTMALSVGMLILTYIVGISPFGEFTRGLSITILFLIFILFSLFYATIWNVCFKKFIHFLIKINILI